MAMNEGIKTKNMGTKKLLLVSTTTRESKQWQDGRGYFLTFISISKRLAKSFSKGKFGYC
jgi:hypothetical protein